MCYTFKIIRSSSLQTLDVFSDEECSERLKLAPDFTPFSNGTYAINVPLETTAIWMKTSVAPGSRTKADLYVGGEKCENTTSAEVKVDLTKFTPDENGSVTIPIEVRYKGAAGTGQSASYALKVNFVDCMPVITEQPQNVEVDKGKTAVLSVDATCTKGELSYQWYAGNAGVLNDEKPIEGATGKTLEVVSQKAGKTAYMIQAFLDSYAGDTVCSKQLYKEALNHAFDEPKQWEIREINEIMNQCVTGWTYFSNLRSFAGYGRQKGWEREKAATGSGNHAAEIPDGFVEITEQIEMPF